MPFLPRLTAWLITILLLGAAALAGGPSEPRSAPSGGPEARHVTTALLGTANGPFFDLGAVEGAELVRLEDELAALAAEEARQEAEKAAQEAEVARLAAVQRVPNTQPAPVQPYGDIWWQLALCESGGNPATNTGNGFYGAFQFMLGTWQGVGGTGYPHEHTYEVQLHYAQILQARSGWGQWPGCARRLGLL